jgi:U4/U6 small nuclear ribonucleoprotein PRP3
LNRIRYLSNPSHKYKVKKTAIDDHLTGVICHNPKFCLVVVEGGAKGLKHYRKLMLERIDWTEETRLREGDEPYLPPQASGSDSAMGAELSEPQSLADNYCTLVWEGQHRERVFRDMRHANCPSEANVKEVLGAKLEGMWDVAKVEVKEED